MQLQPGLARPILASLTHLCKRKILITGPFKNAGSDARLLFRASLGGKGEKELRAFTFLRFSARYRALLSRFRLREKPCGEFWAGEKALS